MIRPLVPVLHGASLDRPDEADTVATAAAVAAALGRLGHRAPVLHIYGRPGALDPLVAMRPNAVFNLVEALDGVGVRAGEVPAALEARGIPFTGCGATATRRCLSKVAMKRTLRAAGLPTPAFSLTGAGLDPDRPVIVKSVTEHASIGIDAGSVVPAQKAAAEIRARAGRFGGEFFAEAFVEGREFNLSILDGPGGPEVLPPAEIEFVDFPADRPRIVDYEAKWIEDGFAYANTPRRFAFPDADRALLARLAGLARRVWRLFGLAGYARVDFRVDGRGRPFILEVNTNPCIAPEAGFVAAAAEAGLDHDALVARILAAVRRPVAVPAGGGA